MQDFPKDSSPKDKLFMILGSIVGSALSLIVINALPIAQSTVVSALLLATLIVTCSNFSNPLLWWMGVGAIAGVIVGVGGVMAGSLAVAKDPGDLTERLTFASFQGIAGFIAGVILGRKVHKAHLPSLKEFISSLSALTAGLFAVVVTICFVMQGLEPARSLSSRLSASTTILITLVTIPGAIGYVLTEHRTQGKSNIR